MKNHMEALRSLRLSVSGGVRVPACPASLKPPLKKTKLSQQAALPGCLRESSTATWIRG